MLNSAVLLKDGKDVFESDINTGDTQNAKQFAAAAALPHRRLTVEIAHNH